MSSIPALRTLAAAIPVLSASLLLGACSTDRGTGRDSRASEDTRLAPATAAAIAPTSEPGQPSAADLKEIAHRLVTTSLGVHPGDVVVIDGSWRARISDSGHSRCRGATYGVCAATGCVA